MPQATKREHIAPSTQRRSRQLAAEKENALFAINQHLDCKTTKDDLWHFKNKEKTFSNPDVVDFRNIARLSASSKFWNDQSNEFIKVVLSTSHHSSLSHGALLLQELHINLLNECRKCIKEITEEKQWNKRLQSNLYIVSHGLRAATMALDEEDQKSKDTVAKILYHGLVITSERIAFITDKGTVTSICISLYECLGRVLLNFRLGGLKFINSNNDLVNFPIPAESCHNINFSNIGRSQLLKLGIQATLALLNVIFQGKQHGESNKDTRFLDVLKCCTMDDVTNVICKSISTTFIAWVRKYTDDITDLKEVVSFLKAAHRLLWEVAATESDKQKSLQVRQIAILALLLRSSNGLDKSSCDADIYIREKCGSLASNWAWKAAVSYGQQKKLSIPPSDDSNLVYFYSTIGQVLDDFFSSSVHKPISYFEFCIYRLLHIGMARGQRLSKCSLCKKIALGDAVLNIVMMITSLKNNLEEIKGGSFDIDFPDHYDSADSLLEIKDVIIDVFQESLSKFQVEDLCRYYQLLSQFSLSQEISSIRQVLDDTTDSKKMSVFCLSVLDVVCTIVIKCIIVFLKTLIMAKQDCEISGRSGYWHNMVDLYSKVILLYEALDTKQQAPDESKEKSLWIVKSDAAIIEVSELLLTNDEELPNPPQSALERFSKLLFSVGKQRNESSGKASKNPTVPLVYSLGLFTKLESTSNDLEFARSYQLGMRYSYVGSVFLNDENNLAAAKLAMIASLTYHAAICADKENIDDPFSSLLCFLMEASRGTELFPSKSFAVSLATRLISTMSTALQEPDENKKSRPSLLSLSLCIKALALDNIMILPDKSDVMKISKMKIEDILISTFSDLLLRCPIEQRGALLVEQGKMGTLLMVRTGLSMQRKGISDEEYSNLRCEFNYFPRLLVRLLKNTNDGMENFDKDFLEGVSYNVTATVLIAKNDKSINTQVEHLRRMLLSRASKSFANSFEQHKCRGKNELKRSLVLESLRIEVTHRQSEKVTKDSEVQNIIEQSEKVVKMFLTKSYAIEDEILVGASLSVQAVLLNLHSELVSSGDNLQAAKVVHWNFALSQKFGSNEALKHWYAAKVMSALTEGKFLSFANRLSAEKYSEFQLSSSYTNLMTVDFWVASIRLKMVTVDYDKLEDVVTELSNIKSILEDGLESFHNDNLEWLYLWVSSSISAAFCDIFTKLQKPLLALTNSKECIKACHRSERFFLGRDVAMGWVENSVLKLFAARRLECLLQTSFIYGNLGDHRKSEAYLIPALEQVGLQLSTKKLTKLSIVGDFAQVATTTQQMKCCNSLLSLYFRASRFDFINTKKSSILRLFSVANFNSDSLSGSKLEMNLERLRIANTFLYYMALMKRSEPLYIDKDMKDAIVISEDLERTMLTDINSSFLLGLDDSLKVEILSETVATAKLNFVEDLLRKNCESSGNQARSICNSLLERKEISCPSLRARAYYYLGLIVLQSGRIRGELDNLWNEVGDHFEELPLACEHFENALMLTGEQQSILKRDICRSLALSLGPNFQSQKLGLSADTLIHFSIGSFAREKFIKTALEKDDNRLRDLFNVMQIKRGDEIIHTAVKLVPIHWRTVAVALCPTGDLLLSSLKAGVRKCVCVFPSRTPHMIFDSSIYKKMMEPFDMLINQSECQLHGMDEPKRSSDFTEDSAKRDWWNRRKELDDGLQHHLRQTESLYFDSTYVRSLFGDSVLKGHDNNEGHSPRGNLASKFDAAASNHNCQEYDTSQVDYQAFEKLTVVQLKKELRCRDISFSSRLRKADLIDLLVTGGVDQTPVNDCTGKDLSDAECIVLILDENVHRFSFEGLPFLLKRPITRIQSLLFLLASQIAQSSHFLDVKKARFVLDPESNLGKTTERIMPFIDSLNSRGNDWNWSGVVGKHPSTKFVKESITKRDSLFLYCGHGGGKGSFSQKDIESLVQHSDTSMPCKATIILMGCSSGKLMSVNRKKLEVCEEAVIHFEPEGIALSYLIAGSPCVVGNLWDVTDGDIDRYSLALINSFIDKTPTSIARSVAEARSSCKMKYIVGLAPVCYGLPVTVKTFT